MIIVYPIEDQFAIIYPCPCGLTVEEIAKKDTPEGVPYLIIDEDQVNKYHDFSNPDGVGIGPVKWFSAQIDAEISKVKKMDIAAIAINEIIQDLEAQKRNLS